MAERALVTCPSCGAEVWPYEEMDASGNLIAKCPADDCGQPFPKVAPPAVAQAPRKAEVVPIRGAPDSVYPDDPIPAGSRVILAGTPKDLGTPELRYLRDALTQCEADADALKKRIQRALALLQ